MGNKAPTTETGPQPQAAPTVANLDVNQYRGLWYDVASIPQSYNSDCDFSYAVYQPLGESSMSVNNYCFAEGKPKRQIAGSAWVAHAGTPGKLLVKFEGLLSNQKGDYWIHEVVYDQYALVGSGKPKDMWILCRTPQIEPQLLKKLLEKMRSYGYDADQAVIRGKAVMTATTV